MNNSVHNTLGLADMPAEVIAHITSFLERGRDLAAWHRATRAAIPDALLRMVSDRSWSHSDACNVISLGAPLDVVKILAADLKDMRLKRLVVMARGGRVAVVEWFCGRAVRPSPERRNRKARADSTKSNTAKRRRLACDDLPPEIVDYILGVLDVFDLLSARHVCRQWRELITARLRRRKESLPDQYAFVREMAARGNIGSVQRAWPTKVDQPWEERFLVAAVDGGHLSGHAGSPRKRVATCRLSYARRQPPRVALT
ncbi:F-box incomplete domain containing protein [Pandoravirus neocaledonia]|uniref:F-box incomplete domain containing protein n=1 Tax=Pandoravirus neocaledonia TaxID=2107708 RepID=A0A2U7UD46_9VIRU|nr:F-box incomplete domain containing protein [Pandoravirus neocaledonia]AVK76391.1 F-box incomplete domain containing protein [Pandoravirus neocaledonia]